MTTCQSSFCALWLRACFDVITQKVHPDDVITLVMISLGMSIGIMAFGAQHIGSNALKSASGAVLSPKVPGPLRVQFPRQWAHLMDGAFSVATLGRKGVIWIKQWAWQSGLYFQL